MDHDRIDPDRAEQDDVAGKGLGQRRLAHRMAAVFHDEGLAGVALQIGQRLDQGLGLGEQRRIGGVQVRPSPSFV